MSFFKKSNRKYRQRIKAEDSDEEKSDKINNQLINENESKTITNNSFNKTIDKLNDNFDQELDDIYDNKSKSKQTNSKLSFHFEEEDEGFH